MSDSVAGYTVSGAYRMLTARTLPIDHVMTALLWMKYVPLKVSVFGWQLIGDRLSSKTNLFRRSIIPSEAQLCVSGCDLPELKHNFFFLYYWLETGLVFIQRIHVTLLIILINLVLRQVLQNHDVLSCI